jgi:hypothetical protein
MIVDQTLNRVDRLLMVAVLPIASVQRPVYRLQRNESDELMKSILLMTVWVASMAYASWAPAADFCVGNSGELQAALDTAASNNESDTIRIRAGDYPVPPGGFDYSPTSAANLDDDLALSGGWLPFLFVCGLFTGDASQTILDGSGTDPVMQISLPSLGDLDIRFLSFVNGTVGPKEQGAGLTIRPAPVFSGRLNVSNNVFRNNASAAASGLLAAVFGDAGVDVRILNNIFIDNSALLVDYAAGAVVQLPSKGASEVTPADSASTVTFAHNTVSHNQSVASAGGVYVAIHSAEMTIASNNLWGNSGDDLVVELFGGSTIQPLRLVNNNIQSLGLEGTTSPTLDEGNISVEPAYEDCGPRCFELVPVLDSPLINAGLDPVALGLPWEVPITDAAGEPRINGPRIDIGTYEAIEAIFADRFEALE